jgi:hypothetical protein
VKYVPTVRSLLATYDFLSDVPAGGGQPVFKDVDSDPNQRNALLLDLNDGLDLDYQLSDLSANNTYTQPDGTVRNPTAFVDALTGDAVVIYGDAMSTPTNVVTRVGPTGALNQVVPFDAFIGSVPTTGQKWYEDQALDNGGDGTVPVASSRDLFKGDSDPKPKPFELTADPNTTLCQDQLDHLGMMWSEAGQKLVLNRIDGLTYTDAQISRCSANNAVGSLNAAIQARIISRDDIVKSTTLDDMVRGVLLQGFTRLGV